MKTGIRQSDEVDRLRTFRPFHSQPVFASPHLAPGVLEFAQFHPQQTRLHGHGDVAARDCPGYGVGPASRRSGSLCVQPEIVRKHR